MLSPQLKKICLHFLQQVFFQFVYKLISHFLGQESDVHFILFVMILRTADSNKK